MIDKQFLNKYKNQYYNSQKSIEQLKIEQTQLINILCDMNEKLDKQVNKAYMKKKMNINIKSLNRSFQHGENTTKRRNGKARYTQAQKQNRQYDQKDQKSENRACFLPVLVIQSELKNSKIYKSVLSCQNNKLQRRRAQLQHKPQQLKTELQQNSEKITNLHKQTKKLQVLIKKNGQQIINNPTNCRITYDQLNEQLSKKNQTNQTKRKKIQDINTRIYQYQQSIMECDKIIKQKSGQMQISPSQKQENQQLQKKQQLEKQYNKINNKKCKLETNVASINKKYKQQYYSKLQQLSSQKQCNQQLSQKFKQLELKIEKIGLQIKQEEQNYQQKTQNINSSKQKHDFYSQKKGTSRDKKTQITNTIDQGV